MEQARVWIRIPTFPAGQLSDLVLVINPEPQFPCLIYRCSDYTRYGHFGVSDSGQPLADIVMLLMVLFSLTLSFHKFISRLYVRDVGAPCGVKSTGAGVLCAGHHVPDSAQPDLQGLHAAEE